MASCSLVVGLIIVLTASNRVNGESSVSVDVAKFGKVNGYQQRVAGKNIHTYLGIPFAKPPIDDLRFRPPQPLSEPGESDVTYDATNWPATCFQTIDREFEPRLVDMWNPNTNLSEDCLYLNIWKRHPADNAAVMVWIYGGGFQSGTSTLDLYDGRVLAAEGGVIVVSMQYRLGALGFLYLGTESAPGNAGLLDQQLALRWIHDHIADFGGDPERVTIFGESAGAASVGFHLLSPGSDELFRSAIMESATPVAGWSFMEQEEAKNRAYELAELMGCTREDAGECLRKADAAQLTMKQWDVRTELLISFNFVPTVDENFIMKSPMELLKSREFQRKSILLGANNHEGAYFVIYAFPDKFYPSQNFDVNVTADEYRDMVKQLDLFGRWPDAVTETIASAYSLPCPASTNRARNDALSYFMSLDGIFGDRWFTCPVVNMANTFAKENKKEGNHSVFVYAFNHRTNGNPWPKWAGEALHGYEIDHVFGYPHRRRGYSDDEKTLSNRMVAFWTNFAKRGDPSAYDHTHGSNKPDWPEYTVEGRQVLVLDTQNELQTQMGLKDRHCHFWSEVVPALQTATSGRVSVMRTCSSMAILWTSFLTMSFTTVV